MTGEQQKAEPVVLTEKETEQVTGGQSLNVFLNSTGTTVKTTGSLKNVTTFPANGTVNVHFHEHK